MPLSNNRRSQRLRKKLRVGEYQEFGFQFAVTYAKELAESEAEVLIDSFLNELIEPRNLALAGWVSGGYIAYFGRGSASDADREAVREWFLARPEVTSVEVGPLVDAWR